MEIRRPSSPMMVWVSTQRRCAFYFIEHKEHHTRGSPEGSACVRSTRSLRAPSRPDRRIHLQRREPIGTGSRAALRHSAWLRACGFCVSRSHAAACRLTLVPRLLLSLCTSLLLTDCRNGLPQVWQRAEAHPARPRRIDSLQAGQCWHTQDATCTCTCVCAELF